MARDVEELAAFRTSAERLDSVMREQDRVIERIMSDLQQEMDERIREVRNLREEAEDTARTAENKLWHIDHDVRYARSDEDKLDYWQETRRQAVILAEAKAEAEQRAQRAADYEAELLERKKDFDDAVFRVMQLLHGPGNRYTETLGLSVMNLERALDEYYATDISGNTKHL